MIPVDLKNRFILVYFDVSLDSTSFYIYLLNIHFIFHNKFSCFKFFDIFEVKVQSEVKNRSIDFFERFKTFLFGDGLKTVENVHGLLMKMDRNVVQSMPPSIAHANVGWSMIRNVCKITFTVQSHPHFKIERSTLSM